jgi:hypothetical protein
VRWRSGWPLAVHCLALAGSFAAVQALARQCASKGAQRALPLRCAGCKSLALRCAPQCGGLWEAVVAVVVRRRLVDPKALRRDAAVRGRHVESFSRRRTSRSRQPVLAAPNRFIAR